MPAPNASREAMLLPHILRLARKGSYAAPDGSGDFGIFSPRNNFASPFASLSAEAIEEALSLGWLQSLGTDGRLELSVTGARRVRRHLSEARGSAVRKAPDPALRPHLVASHSPIRTRPQRIEGPLAWLRRRKDRDGRPLIAEAQFDAGERLAADYARAQLEARVTASWSPTAPCHRAPRSGGNAGDASDMAVAARDRIHRVIVALGPEIANLLMDVCCHDIGLEAAEKARGWPVRSGKVVLDMGLTQLARHYGMLRDARADDRPRARGWTDPAFAANLAQWR